MKVLWLVLVVAVVAVVVASVVINLDEVRDFLQQTLDFFLKRPLIIQIIIGLVVWLILMIVGYFIFAKLFEREKGGEAEGWVWIVFFILWPPAWPITVIWLLVQLIMKVFKEK